MKAKAVPGSAADPTVPQLPKRASEMRIAGEVVSDEVIEAHLQRQSAQKGAAERSKREKRTHPGKQTHAVENDSVHTANESARQFDARHEIDRDSELPTSWSPQTTLDAPPPRPGYRQRYIRFRTDNAEDAEHFDECLEEGWRPRKRKSVRKVHELTSPLHGKFGQYYVKRGLILMEIPEDLEIQRARYFKNVLKQMNRGVDENLFKVQNRLMPLMQPERRSSYSLRARRGRLEVPGDEVAAEE